MTYVTSDLHGCSKEDFIKCLIRIQFTFHDNLYILGDVIDRNGDGGISLLDWIIDQPSIHFALGNHEDMMLNCRSLFMKTRNNSKEEFTDTERMHFDNWLYNGGSITCDTLSQLYEDDPTRVSQIFDYLDHAPLYYELSINGKKYILVHAGFDHFDPDKPLESYTKHDLIWARPSLNTTYYHDRTVILGHTPTYLFGSEYDGQIIKTNSWIDIDVGAASSECPIIYNIDEDKVIPIIK